MELTRYARFLGRNALLILAVAVVTAAVSTLAVWLQPVTYQAQSTVQLSLRDPRPLTDYDYDQFYAAQASDLYSASVATWLNSSLVSDTIHNQSGVGEGMVRAKRSGGTIELTATAGSPQAAEALLAQSGKLVSERIQNLTQGSNRSSFVATVASPVVASLQPSIAQSAVSGLVAGALLGLVLALLYEGARRTVRGRDDLPGKARTVFAGKLTKATSAMADDEASRLLREELPEEGKTVLVTDLTKYPGRAAYGLALAYARSGRSVVLIDDHAPAGRLSASAKDTVKVVTTPAGEELTKAAAKRLVNRLGKAADIVMVSTGRTRSRFVSWLAGTDSTVIAVQRDSTRRSDYYFAWQHSDPSDALTVVYR